MTRCGCVIVMPAATRTPEGSFAGVVFAIALDAAECNFGAVRLFGGLDCVEDRPLRHVLKTLRSSRWPPDFHQPGGFLTAQTDQQAFVAGRQITGRRVDGVVLR